MIYVERINTVPQEIWDDITDGSKEGIDKLPCDFNEALKLVDRMWILRGEDDEALMVIAVNQSSILGNLPEFWVLACNALKGKISYLRQMRRDVNILFKGYDLQKVRVDKTFKIGQKFAMFFGFKPAYEDKGFITYKR